MKRLIKFVTVSAAILVGCVVVAHGLNAQRSPAFLINDSGSGVSGDDPWSPGDLMQPEELARSLSGQQKPAMLQVGIVHLYKMSHIPGSKFAGPANEAGGIAELKKQAQGMNRNREVVCYCGCCPWANCPNMRPAYLALRDMGFKKIKLLYLEHSFGEDWVTKGYPVEKGS